MFGLMTLLVGHVLGSPLRPRYLAPHPSQLFWEQLIAAGRSGIRHAEAVREAAPMERQDLFLARLRGFLRRLAA